MQVEFLSLLAFFVFVTVVGWGVLARFRLPQVPTLALFFLGPIMGLTLIAATLLAGYLHLGPLGSWSHGYTIALALLALASIIFRAIQERRQSASFTLPWIPALGTLLFGVLAFLVIAWPALVNGIQYSIFRASGSDAFVYASLADNFRTNSFPQLLDIDSTPEQLSLLKESPGALFTARLFARYLPSGSFLMQGYVAEIFGFESHRIGHFLACLGLLALGTTAVAVLLGAGLRVAWACAIGFFILANPFTRFTLELDATAQALTFGIFLAYIYFWAIGRDEERFSYTIPALAALCVAALCVTYHSLLPIVAVAAIMDLLLAPRKSVLVFHLRTGVLLFVWLACTGQLAWVMTSFLSTARDLNQGVIDGYPAITEFFKPFPKLVIAHIYGLFSPLPYWSSVWDTAVKLTQFALGATMLVLSGLAFVVSIVRSKKTGVIYLAGVCILSITVFALFALKGNSIFIVGKLILTAQPLLCLTAFWMLYTLIVDQTVVSGAGRSILAAGITLAVILLPLSMLPALTDVSSPKSSPLGYASLKFSNFDFSQIHAYLSQKKRKLSIDVSDKHDWRLTYVLNAEMRRYNPVYVSGYTLDNLEESAILGRARPTEKTHLLLTTDQILDERYRVGWKPVARDANLVLLERTGIKPQIGKNGPPKPLLTRDWELKEAPLSVPFIPLEFSGEAADALQDHDHKRKALLADVTSGKFSDEMSFAQQISTIWSYSGIRNLSPNYFTSDPQGREVGVVGWDSAIVVPPGKEMDLYTFGVLECTFVFAHDETGRKLAMHYSGYNVPSDGTFHKQVNTLREIFGTSEDVTMFIAGAYADRLAVHMRQVMPSAEIKVAAFPKDKKTIRSFYVSTDSDSPEIYFEERPLDMDVENLLYGQFPNKAMLRDMFVPLSYFWPSSDFPSKKVAFDDLKSESEL